MIFKAFCSSLLAAIQFSDQIGARSLKDEGTNFLSQLEADSLNAFDESAYTLSQLYATQDANYRYSMDKTMASCEGLAGDKGFDGTKGVGGKPGIEGIKGQKG